MRLATLLVVLVGAAMLRRYGYLERPEAAASDEVQPSPFLTPCLFHTNYLSLVFQGKTMISFPRVHSVESTGF